MQHFPQGPAWQTTPQTHHVQWRVSSATVIPAIWRHCSRCDGRMRFICSGKFRVNAQKKILDAWLIYNCGACDRSWNYPILERRPVKNIGQHDLTAMTHNDPLLVRSYATDLQRFRQYGIEVDAVDEIRIDKAIITAALGQPMDIAITVHLSPASVIRLDRLLAQGLFLSRKAVARLLDSGALLLFPEDTGRLRQPAQDGQRVVLHLPALADEPALQRDILKACGVV